MSTPEPESEPELEAENPEPTPEEPDADSTETAESAPADESAASADPEGESESESGPASETDADPPDESASPSGTDLPEGVGFRLIVEADVLGDLLDTVDVLVEECKIHVDGDERELRVRAVDPANVGMVDTALDADAFEHFNVRDSAELIGVNLSRLSDIIGMADAGQVVELELESKTRKLHIQIGGLEYTLALIDPDSIREEPDIPDLDLSAEVVVEGREIGRATTAADMVSDHIALGVDVGDEVCYFDAEGDTDDVHVELDETDYVSLVPGEAHSLFSLDYLKDMSKAIPDDAEVTIELGEEFPLKMHFEFGEGQGHVTYMLAPRIQSD